jgi:uncharacterized membrane protein (UPF0127 family)
MTQNGRDPACAGDIGVYDGATRMASRAHFLVPGLSGRAPSVALCVNGPDRCLAHTVELALDSAARRTGLLDRDGLAPATAFVIAPCSAVHTFGMKFPIDIIFTARDGRVIKVRAAVPKSRVAVGLGAFAVVEMAAGSARDAGVRTGDRLVLLPRE